MPLILRIEDPKKLSTDTFGDLLMVPFSTAVVSSLRELSAPNHRDRKNLDDYWELSDVDTREFFHCFIRSVARIANELEENPWDAFNNGAEIEEPGQFSDSDMESISEQYIEWQESDIRHYHCIDGKHVDQHVERVLDESAASYLKRLAVGATVGQAEAMKNMLSIAKRLMDSTRPLERLRSYTLATKASEILRQSAIGNEQLRALKNQSDRMKELVQSMTAVEIPKEFLSLSALMDKEQHLASEYVNTIKYASESAQNIVERWNAASNVASYHSEQVQAANKAANALQDSFKIQELASKRLLGSLEQQLRLPQARDLSHLTASFSTINPSLIAAVEAIRHPWIDQMNPRASTSSFAKVCGIGEVLNTQPGYSNAVISMLRDNLGDWRGAIDWPKPIFDDPFARESFYESMGFDSALTILPEPVFDECLHLAGLQKDIIDAETRSEDHDEAGFRRANHAHDELQRFEVEVRAFIEATLQQVFGPKWMRQQIDGDMLRDWKGKRQKDLDHEGVAAPPIAYADFTDYIRIITRKDNWEQAFKPIFKRKENITESFQRLFPIRLCTMHARTVTKGDLFFMYAETTRVLRVVRLSRE